jgi:hypothetical protein
MEGRVMKRLLSRNDRLAIKAAVQSVLSDLQHGKYGDFNSEDAEGIDIRLQVMSRGDWYIHTGDASYDTDHRGFWGSSTLDTESDYQAVAADMIGEAEEAYACDVVNS